MQHDEHNGRNRNRQDDERQDEESSLLSRLFGRLRDPKRIYEGVGEKVYETHAFIMLRGGGKRNFESSV